MNIALYKKLFKLRCFLLEWWHMEGSEEYHNAMTTIPPQPLPNPKDKAAPATGATKPPVETPHSGDSLATVAPGAPVTAERRIRTDLAEHMPLPYLARAMVAADAEHPQGTQSYKTKSMSVLQQHASFFDFDKDGIIYPWETYRGLREVGLGIAFSLFAAAAINIAFSWRTWPGLITPTFFLLPIYISNIHRNKHGSDTGTYDTEGRFCPANFEDIFSKYARTVPDKLTLFEVWNMTEANRYLFDFGGWIAAKGEWLVLYVVARDEKGLLSKEAVRGCYDGSLFYYISEQRRRPHKQDVRPTGADS